MSKLSKMQTPPGFPNLGVSGVRSPTPIVTDDKQVATKLKGAYSADVVQRPHYKDQIREHSNSKLKQPPAGINFSATDSGYAMSTDLRRKHFPHVQHGTNTDLATQQHENWHDVMSQVQQKYGPEARRDLAGNIVRTLQAHPTHGGHVWKFKDSIAQTYDPKSPQFNEEVLGKLHNYMNDPVERRKFWSHYGDDMGHGVTSENFHSGLKRAWSHFQHLASKADEDWLRPERSIAKEDLLRKSEDDTNEVTLIQVMNGNGELLFGKRNDNGKWTLPGGHLNPRESPEDGARRELFEETGLAPESLTFLRTRQPNQPGGPVLHCFTAFATGTPHSDNDPDDECDKWVWVDVKGGLPPEIYDKLHGPEGDENVVREAFDMKKAEAETCDKCDKPATTKVLHAEGMAYLPSCDEHKEDFKHDFGDDFSGFRDMKKSEVGGLLQHPNPVERTMALKLSSTTPEDVATAAQDPDEMVWRTALLHPYAEHAKAVMAASTRLHDGTPLWSRHDVLLQDPDVKQCHLHAMYNAVLGDPDIAPEVRHIRLDHIASHPNFATAELKKHWGDDRISKGSAHRGPADASAEETPPHLRHLEASYKEHIDSSKPIEPEDADINDGWMSPKVIYKVPVDGHEKHRSLMVKPYSEKGSPLSGWAEASSQALYHAAGIGHLHQQSFVAPHGVGGTAVPATVIHVEPAHPAMHDEAWKALRKHPNYKEEVRKTGLMDFLTGNNDRHMGNFMVRHDGTPMAIDHAEAFSYRTPSNSRNYKSFVDSAMAPSSYLDDFKDEDHHKTLQWWSSVKHDVLRTFAHRLNLIKDAEVKEDVLRGFKRHVEWLDAAAKTAEAGGKIDWSTPAGYVKPLNKKMPDSVHKEVLQAKPYHGAPADIQAMSSALKDSHIGFLGTHPEEAQKGFDSFEKNIAQSPTEVKPVMGRFAGMEPKAVFKGDAGQHFLLKGYHAALSPATGWNELTSQAAYHAGGIGHLHQKAHLTLHGHDRAPGVVIHMAPNHCTVDQDSAHDGSRLEKVLENPQHMESLRRIGLMDVITNNPDRHNSNLMLGSDGSPLAIDHGLAFTSDHDIAANRYHDYNHELPGFDNAAWNIGGKPNEETWKWWDEKKPAILKAIEEHANHIPDVAYRRRFMDNVRDRFDRIDASRQET